MAYNKARAEKQWLKWKEAEEIKKENERKYITVMLTEAVSVVLMKIKTE